MTQTDHFNQAGYTIIELVIVIALTVILLITAISMFFTTFIGGGKTASAEYTKQAGQNSLNQITFLIRNARKLIPNDVGTVCGASMHTLGLQNQDGGTTYLSLYQTKIASSSALPVTTANTSFVTPDDVDIIGTLDFTCDPSSYGTATWDGSPPRITVSYTLQKGITGTDKERDIVTIPFDATVTMRNF